ncbi:MAG: TRAP transporter TatT component family protein [Myxococcota bacterium]
MRSVSLLLIVLPLSLGSTGCIKSMILNGQIAGTRQASGAFDTMDDYEIAGRAAASGLVQFEGMHKLAPGNTDALFMLTKAYTGFAFGFIEDEMERAEDDSDSSGAAYHRQRAINAYNRAVNYGLELLGHTAEGFDAAKVDEATLKAWLERSFTSADDAGALFWTGYAWMARTGVMKDDAEMVANLWMGVAMIERSVALDPTYNNGLGKVALGAYHARSAAAEMDEAKALFEDVIAKTEGKALVAQLNYATRYACAKADAALYTKLLRQVIDSKEDEPSLRLTNTIAKRRAKRWLSEKRMFDACSMDPLPPEAAAQTPAS